MLGASVASDEFRALLVGALTHDVGKLWQRTGDRSLRDRVEAEYRWYNPRGREGATHEKWSAYFIQKYLPQFRSAETIALRHHSPEDDLERMVQLADWLSSGEREPREPEGGVAREPLLDIFVKISGVKDHGRQEAPVQGYIPLRKLELEESALFPTESKEGALSSGGYAELFCGLRNSVREAVGRYHDFDDLLRSLHDILYAYLSPVPSAAYAAVPDVSLFDHSRSTAAIAACLYMMRRSGRVDSAELHRDYASLTGDQYSGPMQFLLIGGDVSGVQDFIYNITSSGAAKGLKGRSLHLQLLTDAVLSYVLRHLGLPFLNVIYSAGGHFFLLAPLTAEEQFERARKEVNKALLGRYGGRLALVMASVPLTPADFERGRFGERWAELQRRLAVSKNQKLLELLDESYDEIFGPFEVGGARPRCEVCKTELPEGSETGPCAQCLGMQRLAEDAARARYLVVRMMEGRGASNSASSFPEFGIEFRFLRDASPSEIGQVFVLNRTDFLESDAHGFRFMCTHTPFEGPAGNIKTFEALAQDAHGFKGWGVLRADIDDLGDIFSRGLSTEDRSISRYSTLSRRLSCFFEGWMNCIARRHGDRCYVIYSGGDDLFMVASWDVLPILAREIREEFERFCSRNPELTISAGLFLAPSVKYPLSAAAQQAKLALDGRAKGMVRECRGRELRKDAVDFLGQTHPWQEIPFIYDLKDRLLGLLEPSHGEAVSRALLQLLYAAHVEQQRAETEDYIPRIWRLVYGLKRMAERHRSRKRELMELLTTVVTDGIGLRSGVLLATRWVELLTRKERT